MAFISGMLVGFTWGLIVSFVVMRILLGRLHYEWRQTIEQQQRLQAPYRPEKEVDQWQRTDLKIAP